MGIPPYEDAVRDLRKLRSFKTKDIVGHPFGVCALPMPQGQLTDEEYAPYLAAADGKHDSYMRHGAPWAPSDLAYEVTVRSTVVAWLPYNGVPRVIERDFSDAEMNRARDLAREHLGADPETQQTLADERGAIERLSADGFARVIHEHLDRAEHGSVFNDYPTHISVREYDRLRSAELQAEAKAKADPRPGHFSGSREIHVHVPNPTVEYTDQQRREWALEAAHYLAAYRDRFPTEYTLWMTDQHHTAHREGKKLGPLQVRPGDRVGFTRFHEMKPAIILSVEEGGADLSASIRTEEDEFERWWIYPQNVTPETELLPETRELFGPKWDRLTVAPGSSGPCAEPPTT